MRNAIAVLALLTLAIACSRLTPENYAKLKVGMSYDDTKSILGTADRCSDAVGVKSCTWGDDARYVRVNFVAEKVILYTAENVR